MRTSKIRRLFTHRGGPVVLILASLILGACSPGVGVLDAPPGATNAEAGQSASPTETPEPLPTLEPVPTRPIYQPGELVDYIAQTGDTLPGLALRFNTRVEEIREANSFIPADATTMPPGMPMKIPIYYLPLWGSSFQILPDSLFVNGPAQVGFDTGAFVNSQPGWLKDYSSFVSDRIRSGAEIVDLVALRYSVSPRLLLALLEHQAGALSQPTLAPEREDYPLGYRSWDYKGVFLQLSWAANQLNNGYYDFRTGALTELEFRDGRLMVFDPWQNAATASLHFFFNTIMPYEQYLRATSSQGFFATYKNLFGDPWEAGQPHMPGSLAQPEFQLPFEPGNIWAYTGGPHTAWGRGEPLAAIDFAPPSKTSGCQESAIFATAIAPGLVVRSETGIVVLDLDGDGDERTGWNIFYLHLATLDRAQAGAQLEAGDRVGHPSCEGGRVTGTHVHIARKYNGEWIPASGWFGMLAFDMEGWIVHNGYQEYQGTLTRFSQTVTACECSNAASFIQTDRRTVEAQSNGQ